MTDPDLQADVEQALAEVDRDDYPEMVDVTDLMSAPEGMVQVGDEFRVVDPDAAGEDPAEVVGICERCGHELRDTPHGWSRAVGHTCEDGYREHPDGEDIREVPA